MLSRELQLPMRRVLEVTVGVTSPSSWGVPSLSAGKGSVMKGVTSPALGATWCRLFRWRSGIETWMSLMGVSTSSLSSKGVVSQAVAMV